MPNLMDALLQELNRNRELLALYRSIPEGAYGALIIERDITDGEKAIAGGDTVAMLRIYERLKENKS